MAERHPESLAREIWAIGILYLAISILPLIVGWLFAPEMPS